MKSFIILAIISTVALCSHGFIGPMRNYKDSEGLGHVERHGQLQAVNGRIVNQYGDNHNTHGMSMFWSQWSNFWNADVVNWLVSDWKIKILRCAMAANQGGYLDDPTGNQNKLTTVVDAAIANDIYAIIDWHIEGGNIQFLDRAKVFFDHMAKKYGKNNHVMYEGYNEPTYESWGDLKNYHANVLGCIRAYTNNLYIAGNPGNSSQPHVACDDRLDGVNIAYTLHFYAASHKQEYRDRANSAIGRGCAVAISEWGTCEYTGNGFVDENESRTWLNWANEKGVLTANWSLNDKPESCSALTPGAPTNGGWNDGQLTQSGHFMKNFLNGGNGPHPTPGNGCCSWNTDCRHNSDRGDWCDQAPGNCTECGGHWINL